MSRFTHRLKLIEGVVIGASAVYLLDPEKGGRRRRELADWLGKTGIASYQVVVSAIEKRRSQPGRRSRRFVAVLSPATLMRFLRRQRGFDGSDWEMPMATVDIDIDQGVVTLSGVFSGLEEGSAEEPEPTPPEKQKLQVLDGNG